jgi:hypothetical protein
VYYESYLNSKTRQALQEIFDRGGVLSGTSAGMAILSPVVFTAQGATIYPASAAANPYTSQITLKDDFLATLENPYIFAPILYKGAVWRDWPHLWQTGTEKRAKGYRDRR